MKQPVKKRMGRPRTEPTQIGVRLLPETLAVVDEYAVAHGLTRGMAVRAIVDAWARDVLEKGKKRGAPDKTARRS